MLIFFLVFLHSFTQYICPSRRCLVFIIFQALVAAQLKMGADKESRKRAWEENELSSLAKAIVKFPAGSQNRE